VHALDERGAAPGRRATAFGRNGAAMTRCAKWTVCSRPAWP